MAWETQGPIADRTVERLGVSDMGIAIWRRLLHEQIKIVQDGGDPMCVFRSYDGIIDVGPSRRVERRAVRPQGLGGLGRRQSLDDAERLARPRINGRVAGTCQERTMTNDRNDAWTLTPSNAGCRTKA